MAAFGLIRPTWGTWFDYKPVLTNETGEESSIKLGEEGIAAESTLEDYDAQTLYYASCAEDLYRYACRRQEAHDWAKAGCRAQGNVRQLQAGQWFSLTEHPFYDKYDVQGEREFVVCGLRFNASNNLPDGLSRRLTSPAVGDAALGVPYIKPGVPSPPKPYWVEIDTRKRGLPLAPAFGHTDYAKPRALGIQTATVTGPGREEVYTDEMGRIKIQFHWQRPKEHPGFGANLDERSSCWVRVAYPGAGGAWGHQNIPRIGQEVLIDFIEGDIDRPVVSGVIHNGQQSNPWFSGTGALPGNRTLTGIKTKEHHGQQYGELLFDDTPDQVRTKLSSEHGKTQLNQGFLTHPRQDGDAEPRGDGFELRTDRHGALRAAEGLLLSTETKPGATGKQIDREQAESLLEAARQNAQTLADVAGNQNADVMETGPEERDKEGSKGSKTNSGHLDHMVEAVKAWEANTNTGSVGADGNPPASQPGKQPVILLSGAEGIGLATPRELVLAAKKNLDTVSQRDTQQSTARRWIHNAGAKISLFVHGIADKFNLKLITAKGHAKMEAQAGDVEITGDKSLRVSANKQKLTATAAKEMLIACGGAYIRMTGGNIDIHCPGPVSFKSAGRSFSGPASMAVAVKSFGQEDLCDGSDDEAAQGSAVSAV